jgi:outer membrane protein assembly factor BamD (BamD/ComL family)
MKSVRIILLLTGSALLWACSSAQDDWKQATSANTVAAYQQFLSKHPTGDHSADATERIHTLQDDDAWAQAKQANSIEAYRDYMQKQPAGSHVKDAQDALTAAQRASDWQSAQTTGTVAAVQDFLKKYPDGPEVSQAQDKLKALAGYKVRVAGGTSEKQAQKERDKLLSKHRDVLHDVVVVSPKVGKTYDLESAPMSQADANSACEQLKKAHQKCEVVKS